MSKRTPCEWQVSSYVQQAVEQIIKTNPEMYAKAQEFGEYMLSSRFANVEQMYLEKKDIEGENILYRKILGDIKQYGFNENDLNSYEIEILKNKLGHDYISIFTDENKLDSLINS